MVSRVKDLFEAEAGSFGETMVAHNNVAGYKIPDYQRQYNWKKEHLSRLLADCLNGFSRLSTSSNPEYTFLGSIILATDSRKESTFDGTSLIVVDGQQRLTSLILMTCALFQQITDHKNDVQSLATDTRAWLNAEIEAQLTQLQQCAVGQFTRLGRRTHPYPRMIRSTDQRADSTALSKYQSPIGRFLELFEIYATEESSAFQADSVDNDAPGSQVWPSYKYIYDELGKYLYHPYPQSYEDDTDEDIDTVSKTSFRGPGYLQLFRRRDFHSDTSTNAECLSEIVKSSEVEGLIRLILFSSYVTQRVVLTRVEARNQEYAFDIFDALNTTGEPLTALETCKPLVIQFEDRLDGYLGSQSKVDWESMESKLAEVYGENPTSQQLETKRMLTSFALYYDGYKLQLDLARQRRYLRDRFQRAVSLDADIARGFVASLREMAEFRLQYWDKAAIDDIGVSVLGVEASDSLKLCLRFIADMNTSLSIPILARYWSEYGEGQSFLSATRAIAAFLALRRSVTEGTARIDSDFRHLMNNTPKSGGDPLCIGQRIANQILPIEYLKEELREFLKDPRIGVTDKSSWLDKATAIEFGNQASQPLCRFLLFAATHNAHPDTSSPGLLTDLDVVEGGRFDFFNHRTWVDRKYATVEHIAPVTNPGSGWPSDIYSRAATRQLMGNLLLLPEKENQGIGNSGWEKKKIFYTALASPLMSERASLSEDAQSQGYTFGPKTQELLQSEEHLSMLEHLVGVDQWTAKLIELRTKNILGLAWDQIAPWLFDD